MKSVLHLILVASLLLAASLRAQPAATGIVRGTVSDASTQLSLGGVRVAVAGLANETYTGAGGAFTLTNVPAGIQTVTFSYVGYPELTRPVAVVPGQPVQLDVEFNADGTVRMDAFKIEGSLVGTARAINQQRASDTLTNIVAADDIGRFPDQNAAESIQRIPGVALYRDQGEGRFIVVRGIRPDLNGVSLNGVPVTSPDRGARTVPLDVIPSDALGAIEVVKVPTPDLPAEGLGGYVNLKTRSAFDTEGRRLQLAAQGQYNDLRDRLSSKFDGTYSEVLNDGRLGLIFSSSWQARRFGSDNFEVSGLWAVPTLPGATTALLNPDINYREYQITRTRYGANGAIEFKPDHDTLVYVRATFSHYVDAENRYVTTIPFSEATSITAINDISATVTGVRRENKQLRSREKAQDLHAVSAGAEKTLGDWKLDAFAAYSIGEEDRTEDTAIFRKSARGSTWSYSFANGVYDPAVTQLAGTSINDPSVFNELNRLRSAPATGEESETGVGANARHDFDAAGTLPAFVKFGALARFKTKSQDRETINYAAPASFTFASLAVPQTAADYAYFAGPKIGATEFKSAFIANKGAFTATRDIIASAQEDWKSTEDVLAFYGFGGATIDTLNISAGARYERTSFKARGNSLRTTASSTTITPDLRSSSYDNLLPGVFLRHDLSKRTVLRAAWSHSLARPSFSESALMRSVNDDTRTVNESNPALKALETTNWDASVEHYFDTLGTVSVAVFYKDIKNFTYTTTLPGADPATGYALTTFVNGREGHISGAEFAWQQQLTFLPQPLDGLGLLANYTYTESLATYGRSEKAWFIGQSRENINLAISYEKHGFFFRLAANLRSPRLREDEPVSASAAADIYVDDFAQIDLSTSYKISPSWEIFGEALNLTNEPFRVTQGKAGALLRQFEEYGWSANLGARFKL